MAIKPILFNTEMVRAILDGRKTQTRRIVKQKYGNTEFEMHTDKYGSRLIEIEQDVEGITYGTREDGTTWRRIRPYIEPKPPYIRGDILWVRETWRTEAVWQGSCIGYEIAYKAGGKETFAGFPPMLPNEKGVWHPSIHMPRKAARIFLRVTDVRAERLHDMTDRDAEKEGIGNLYLEDVGFGEKDYGRISYSDSKDYTGLQVEQFAHLWNSTLKKDVLPCYGWEANPWVWVIEFERTENR